MSIRILLADDHKLMREGLRALVAGQKGMEVVGEADGGRSALEVARRLAPDVVIMDVGMPDLNGLEATRLITAELPKVKVIALSMHGDRRFVVGMLQAGARGYLLKDSAFEELAQAVRVVAAGQVYLGQSITGVVVEGYMDQLSRKQVFQPPRLSDREREVVQLIAEGRSTKEIAVRLGVSSKTIETHRQRVMDRLGLHSVAELTKYAVREGLTEP